MTKNKNNKSKDQSVVPSQSSLLGAAPALASTYLAPIGFTPPNPPMLQTPPPPVNVSTTPGSQPAYLPSTAGGNAVPITTTPSMNALISQHSSSAVGENFGNQWSKDMNKDERDATLARNIKAEADAKAGFSSLLGMASESNNNPIVKDIGAMGTSSSLPFIPKFLPPVKEQIPDVKLGQFGETYSYDSKQSQGTGGRGGGPTPKLISDIPLLFKTPVGGLGMKYDKYDSPSATRFTNDPSEIKWFGMDDAKATTKAFNSKLYDNGGDDIGDWKTSSLRGLKPGSKAVEVDKVHDSFDNIVRGTALTHMIENGGRNYIRIRDGKGWRKLNPNEEYGNVSNRDMRIDMSSVVNERIDPTTGKTVSEIKDPRAYNTLMAGIERAYNENGWRGGEKPTGNLYSKIHKDIRNNAFKENNSETIGGILREQATRKNLLHIFGYND